ncbi:hypothetical protein [Nocardioides convexus]|uniref:hypothetical protein n=1 Tax=Nocardioides convexus TaxID=2712224 RepID=UPI002418355C|nr:hypothetical protein [Nocardioides convexus]
MVWFDESRLDDEAALGSADLRLRTLAESGARVRREVDAAASAIAEAVSRVGESRPRAVIAAGPDSRLLRAVLEPFCPVPFVAWPSPALPGWAGSLDLVVVLAPEGGDAGTALAVAEAARRGCQLVVATPRESVVAEHATGRWTTLLPISTGDQTRHRGRHALVPRPGPGSAPAPSRTPSRRRWTPSPSPAPRTATSRSTRPRCWPSPWPTPAR